MRRHLLCVACLAATATAQAELWVEPATGSDSNPGTYTQPLRTLGYAAGLAPANCRINLLPGFYGPTSNGETLPITLGTGAPQPNLVIRGIGPGVVFDLAGSASTVLRLASGVSGLRITNLTFQNTDRVGWWTRVVNSGSGVNAGNAATDVEIDRCRFVQVNRAFVLWTADNVQRWRIHDNLFWDCANDAILEYAGDNDIYHNTFVTGAWKAYISDSVTSRCQNNLVAGYNIAFENNHAANNPARYQHNWIWQTGVAVQGQGFAAGLPATTVLAQDPQFANAAAGDFHLLPTSPCREAGTAAIQGRADLDGVSRLVDIDQNGSLLPDIGCYEATPLQLTTSYDPTTGLLLANTTSSRPNLFSFVLFALEDGLYPAPGQGPILVDPLTFIPAWLSGPAPAVFGLSFANVTVPPGTHLVMHAVGLAQSLVLVGGNQSWVTL